MLGHKMNSILMDAQLKFKAKNPGREFTKCVVPKNMLQHLINVKDVDLYNKRIWGYKLEVDDKLEDIIWE